jgi:hypothetical protein
MKTPAAIDPNRIKVRDALMVALINGVTKSGVQKDQKKERNRRECRRRVRQEDF